MLKSFLYCLAFIGAVNCAFPLVVAANSTVTSSMGNLTYVDGNTGTIYPMINKNNVTATFIPERVTDGNYGWSQSVHQKSHTQLRQEGVRAMTLAPAASLAPAQTVQPVKVMCTVGNPNC